MAKVGARTGAWSLLAAAVIAQATISVAEMGVPTLTPFLADGFSLSAAGAGLLVASLNFGRVIASVPAGQAVDRLGETVVIVVGGVGVAAFVALTAVAATPWQVGLGLIVAGVFAGSATPAGAKFVLTAFPPERRGLPMGIRQSAVPFGTLIAAAMLPAIAEAAGWRTALAVASVLPLIGAVVAWVMLRGDATRRIADERGSKASMRELMRDGNVARLAAWGVLFVGGQYALVTYLILDLTRESDQTLAVASIALAVSSIGGVIGRILWGGVSDRFYAGRRKPAMLLLSAVGTLSAVALIALPAWPRLAPVLIVSLLAGLCLVGWQGIWMSLLSEVTPPDVAGTTMGYGLMYVSISVIAWPPLLGALADLFGTFRASWAAVAAGTGIAALLIPGIHERST